MKSIVFITSLLSSVLAVGQVKEHSVRIGRVGYWSFDGRIQDADGAHNTTPKGAVTLADDRFGSKESAIELYSLSHDVVIANTDISLANDFTIGFWFKANGVSKMSCMNFTNRTSKKTNNLNFAFNDSYGCWVYWDGQGHNNIQSGKIGEYTDNFWHHALLVRHRDTLTLYFDGILKGQKYFPGEFGKIDQLNISSAKNPWIGRVDDICIYTRAISESEIRKLSEFRVEKLFLVNPDGGDSYPIDYSLRLAWQKPANVDHVKIEWSLDNGKTWRMMADRIAETFFHWQLPKLPGNRCKIRVSNVLDSTTFSTKEIFISEYKWELVTEHAPFSIRDGAAALVHQNKMFLIGGWNLLDSITYPKVTNSEVWSSSDGRNWQLEKIAPWAPRHTFGSLVFNDRMWVIGGDQLQCGFQPDVWSSIDGVDWKRMIKRAPWGKRMLHMYFAFENKLWVMGGQKIAGEFCNDDVMIYNDVWNSQDGIRWQKVTDSVGWSPRGQIMGSVVFNDKMWILGGGIYKERYLNDIWNSSDGKNWSLVNPRARWQERQYQNVAVYDSAMWVIAGALGGNTDTNDVWFSRDGLTWSELKGSPWPARHAASVFVYDNALWLVAGNLWNDVWKLSKTECPDVESNYPETIITSVGATVHLNVVSSTPNPTYQWQVEGAAHEWSNMLDEGSFRGTKSSSLLISQILKEHDGLQLRCVVYEGTCSDISANTLIKVD